MLQSEIKIVELQFHKLRRIIIIYFDCDNYTLTDQLNVTVRIYANVVQVVLLLLLLIKQIEYSLSIVLLIVALCY